MKMCSDFRQGALGRLKAVEMDLRVNDEHAESDHRRLVQLFAQLCHIEGKSAVICHLDKNLRSVQVSKCASHGPGRELS